LICSPKETFAAFEEVSVSKKSWRPLEVGDVVDVVAPGYRATEAELAGGVRFLESWGLKPRVPKKIFGPDILSSNNDKARFEQLRDAILAPDSKAVWCIRGGYGSNRLIPHLAQLKVPKGQAKLLVGLSDITSLHAFFNQAWGWPTVHGPLLDRLGRKAALPKYERELKKFVFGHEPEIVFRALTPMNDHARRKQVIRGTVTGGNLIVLQSSLGTPYQWQTDKKILFFEEIGERGYRVDRVLEQMAQAGLFKKAQAIIFGQFTHGEEPKGGNLIWPVLKRFAENANLPVLKGLASGHDIIQRPLPFAAPSELHLGLRELRCLSGCVSGSQK
jgi:muramoyltetrapeptide carboxypeptidase